MHDCKIELKMIDLMIEKKEKNKKPKRATDKSAHTSLHRKVPFRGMNCILLHPIYFCKYISWFLQSYIYYINNFIFYSIEMYSLSRCKPKKFLTSVYYASSQKEYLNSMKEYTYYNQWVISRWETLKVRIRSLTLKIKNQWLKFSWLVYLPDILLRCKDLIIYIFKHINSIPFDPDGKNGLYDMLKEIQSIDAEDSFNRKVSPVLEHRWSAPKCNPKRKPRRLIEY